MKMKAFCLTIIVLNAFVWFGLFLINNMEHRMEYRFDCIKQEIKSEVTAEVAAVVDEKLREQTAKIVEASEIAPAEIAPPEITINIDLGDFFKTSDPVEKKNPYPDINPKSLPPTLDEEAIHMISKAQTGTVPAERIVMAYYEYICRDNPKMNPKLALELAWHYYNQERQYKLAHGLILSIVHVESEHNTVVVSSSGARGLMQIRRDSGYEYGIKLGYWEDPQSKKKPPESEISLVLNDPFNNIRIGSCLLDDYIQKAGSLDEALVRYSGGNENYPNEVREFYQNFWSKIA